MTINTGGYCYYEAIRKINFITPLGERKVRDEVDQWIASNQETCLFCAERFLLLNHKDSVKDHCHISGLYRGTAYNECNFEIRLNAKTLAIPVVFHNLKGYDGRLLMQVMSRVRPVAEIFGGVFVLTGVFINGGYEIRAPKA